MTFTDAFALIASLGALIGSGVGVWVAWRKTPAERANLESGAAERWESIASKSAERIQALEAKVERLELLERENADLRDWAERLVHQVQSLGGEPVKLRVSLVGAK